jgi:pimeloyl-ACP methyl ester carboxylesterase
MKDLHIPVDGGSVNVWHRSAARGAPTAVLIHGLSGTSRWWARVIDHLPADLGIISLDVRGRGNSHEAPPPFDLPTIADDVARALDHLEVDRAIVAGYSMGGWIAALFAAEHHERVRRVLMVDGGFPIPNPPDVDPDDVIRAVVGPSLARLQIDFPDEESFFDYWKAHPALKGHWDDGMRSALIYELARSNGGFRSRVNPEAIEINAREITVDTDSSSAGERVTAPAHLIVVERGTADQPGGMIPLQTAENAAEAMPNLTMEYLPGVNHYTLVLGRGAPAVASAIGSSWLS